MLKNYFKVALRNIKRNKVYAVTNIVGLSAAMMGFIVVALYINYELSYDKFHDDVDDIKIVKLKGSKKIGGYYNNILPAVFADAINQEIPGVTATATSTGVANLTVVGANNQSFSEQYYQFQESFFDIFSFEAQYGNLDGALSDPSSVVISEQIAEKYFNTKNAVGESLNLGDKGLFVVKAVLKEFPHNSQFQPHIVLPISATHSAERLNAWAMNAFFLYLKTDGATMDSVLTKQVGALYAKHMEEGSVYTTQAKLVPFADSYWEWSSSGASMNNRNKGLGADKDIMLICGILAGVLMIIALANYVNMAVSRAIQRAKEVGIRKVNGALPSQLITQFLSESIVFSLISLVVALIALEMLMPSVSNLMGTNFSINYLKPSQIGLLVGYAVFSGLVAGIYPAFFLSRFEPSKILKTRIMGNKRSKGLFKVLLWFQFTLCAFLITVMAIMNGQLSHYFNYDLGFTKAQVVAIPLPRDTGTTPELFFAEVSELPQIKGVTVGPLPNGAPGYNTIYLGDKSVKYVPNFTSNETFIPTLGVTILAGRNINPDLSTDFTDGIIINQSLAKALEMVNPVGQVLQLESYDKTKANKRVLAVIDDMHIQGPASRISPLAILPSKSVVAPRQNLLVRLDKDNITEGLAAIDGVFTNHFEEGTMSYEFLDDAFAKNYHRIQRLTTIINGVTILIISISLFGLFAMIAFSISFRMKEIGVRKVLGVSFLELQWALSKLFLVVISLAIIVAIPAAYYVMDNLLNAFYNRVELTVEFGVYTALGIYLLASITVLAKGLSTLKINPVNILKND